LGGASKSPDFNALSGAIRIHATRLPEDLASWRKQAEDLLEHVRRVLSFAAGSLLRAPVIEYYAGDELEVKVWSQTFQNSPGLRTIHLRP
jgi:hypothetical protein